MTNKLVTLYFIGLMIFSGYLIFTAPPSVNVEVSRTREQIKKQLDSKELTAEFVGTLPNGKKVFRTKVYTNIPNGGDVINCRIHWVYWIDDSSTVNIDPEGKNGTPKIEAYLK